MRAQAGEDAPGVRQQTARVVVAFREETRRNADAQAPGAAREPGDVVGDGFGRRGRVRGIGPGDIAMARRFLDSLSRGTRYFRFGRSDFSYTDEELASLCTPAPERRDHLIAVVRAGDVDEMVGSARYVVAEADGDCEFAVMMRDGWTKRGIASALMQALEQRARERGLRAMHGRILGSNTGMLAFAQRQGFALDTRGAPTQIRTVSKSLVASSGAATAERPTPPRPSP